MFRLQDFSADKKKKVWRLGLLKSCFEDETESTAEPVTRTSNNRYVSVDQKAPHKVTYQPRL